MSGLVTMVILDPDKTVSQRRANVNGEPICVIRGNIYDQNFASAIVEKRLFFSSASYAFYPTGNHVTESRIYWIDLTQQFPAHSFIDASVYNEVILPSGMPAADDYSLLFYDETSLYYWFPNSDDASSMWAYNVPNNTFHLINAPGAGDPALAPYAYASGQQVASVASAGTTYIAGTTNSQPSLQRRDEGTTPWLRAVTTSLGGVTWKDLGTENVLLDAGAMFYLPAGEAGVLIAFGGTDPLSHTQFQQPNLNDYAAMGSISVYDIASQLWYNATTGSVRAGLSYPDSRVHFCGGVSTAPDGSSWQITIYGGFNLEDGHPFNDVWVLSIPSFTWINVTPGDQSNGDGGGYGRSLAQCQMFNDAQMIVLGGQIQTTEQPVANASNCSPDHPPILVLNTVSFEWSDSFSPDLVYSQPSAVYNAIGGNAQGGGPSGPPSGFDSQELASIFAQRITTTTLSASGATVTAVVTVSSRPMPDLPAKAHGSRGLVVVGPILIAVVVILIIFVIFLFVRLRRARKLERAIGGNDIALAAAPDSTSHNVAGRDETLAPLELSADSVPRKDLAPRYG